MDNYFYSTLDDVLRWECVEQLEDAVAESEDDMYISHRSQETVHSQRDYIFLYGSHPKMEDRIFSSCSECEQAFNPHAVASHKENCPGKGKAQNQQRKKKVKSKKKIHGSSVPLPPLFKKESPGPPILSKFSDISPPQVSRLIPDVLPVPEPIQSTSSKITHDLIEPIPSTSSSPPASSFPQHPTSPILISDDPIEEACSTSTSSNRHKKSKKNAKTLREYDPDIHCGVVEGQKGPCTRSITCSNHKLQLRKSVVGRSKNIHLLIAEKKAAKEKDIRQTSPSFDSTISSEFLFAPDNETSNEIDQEIEEIIVHEDVNISKSTQITTITELHGKELHDEIESDDPSNQLESGYCSIETSFSTKSSPVLYYNPISPIFVVTPVQFIQKENTVFVETSQRVHNPPPNGYFLTMPETTANIKLYKSHPKPTILPSYGARKVGGAILSSYKRLEYQRNDIQEAINSNVIATCSTTCKTAPYVPPQRSILLKTKGINKVNFKRSSTDKLSASDSKQIKLATDMNGFILHTEMSEVAETPQSNHCIQENINLLNMK